MSPSGETPRRDELSQLLRQCVQCGLCLPHCATWQATGNDVLSPRGRLLILEDWLATKETGAQDAEARTAYVQAMDRCIGCRACETVCPSGVPFSLLAYGRQLADGAAVPSSGRSWQRSLERWLDVVPVLDALKHLAGLGRGVLRLVAGRRWRRRLDTGALGTGTVVRLLGSMPRSPQDNAKLVHLVTELVKRHDAQAADGARVTADHPVPPQGPDVVFFSGCANEALLPATSSRLLDLLRAGGCQVRHAAGQGCCGALAAHTGRPGRAAAQRRRNRIALTDALGEGAVIVSEAAGCGLELQLYGGELGERVLDATVLLDSLELPTLAPLPLRVAVHDACHLRHGQGVVTEPRRLLQRIPGLQIVQPDEAEVCCGSGGAWGMRHAELSSEIGRRKARVLAETGADLVVTTNVGCLGQIQDGLAAEGLDLPILPLSDVLWVAMDLARRGR